LAHSSPPPPPAASPPATRPQRYKGSPGITSEKAKAKAAIVTAREARAEKEGEAERDIGAGAGKGMIIIGAEHRDDILGAGVGIISTRDAGVGMTVLIAGVTMIAGVMMIAGRIVGVRARETGTRTEGFLATEEYPRKVEDHQPMPCPPRTYSEILTLQDRMSTSPWLMFRRLLFLQYSRHLGSVTQLNRPILTPHFRAEGAVGADPGCSALLIKTSVADQDSRLAGTIVGGSIHASAAEIDRLSEGAADFRRGTTIRVIFNPTTMHSVNRTTTNHIKNRFQAWQYLSTVPA